MNPYTFENYLDRMLDEPGRFIGPYDELKKIIAQVTADRPGSVVILGPWGVGKSVLLRVLAGQRTKRKLFSPELKFRNALGQLFYQHPERVLFVLVTFEPHLRASEAIVFQQLLERLVEVVRTSGDERMFIAPEFLERAYAVAQELVDESRRRQQPQPMLLPMPVAKLIARGTADWGELDKVMVTGEHEEEQPSAVSASSATEAQLKVEDEWLAAYIDLLTEIARRFHGEPQIGFSRERLRLVFLLDNFDVVAPSISIDGYHRLGELLKYVSVVITSSEPLSRIVPASRLHSPFFKLIQHVNDPNNVFNLFFLTREDAKRLIKEPPGWSPESSWFRFSDEDVAYILQLAGLHQEVIRIVCEFIYAYYQRIGPPPGEHKLPRQAQQAFRRLLSRPLDPIFTGLWLQLKDKADHQILALVANGEGDTLAYNDHPSFLRLVELNFIVFRDGSFHLFSTLFEDYVRIHVSDPRATALDELEAGLAGKERELLRLLRQQGEEVTGRELIVASLYHDDQGGASGRLEALVSRLRGKLREVGFDLQNVRGQGYRLVPTSGGAG